MTSERRHRHLLCTFNIGLWKSRNHDIRERPFMGLYGVPFRKKIILLILFLSTWNTFSCNINFFHFLFFLFNFCFFFYFFFFIFSRKTIFRATWTCFCRQQITFCATSNFLFQHQVAFCAIPNFCFGHCLEYYVMVKFLSLGSNKNIITCQRKQNSFLCVAKK